MAKEIEITQLNLRYEGYRMKDRQLEAQLLSSIATRGIEEALEGVAVPSPGAGVILLNGFKRYRCACKLKLSTVPYISLGNDEVLGIMQLLRTVNKKTLNILEQARFIDELAHGRQMTVAEIAEELSRSKAWVSLRLGLIAGMSETVEKELFAGRFPVYSYMYTLRPFMRIKETGMEEIDSFVKAVSGKDLSLREIEQLAHGYFRGPESFRQQILAGHLALPLKQLKETAPPSSACSEFERVLLMDLERVSKYMRRVMGKSQDPQLKSSSFHSQSYLLTAAILSRSSSFIQTIKNLHDRNSQA